MAFQFVQGQLLQPIAQAEDLATTRPAFDSAPHSTGDAAAAYSPEVLEEPEDPAADPATNQPESPPAHTTNELTDEEAREEFDAYQHKQKEFEVALCSITVPENRRFEFQSLLGGGGTTMPHHRFERAAQIAHRDKGWEPQRKLLELLAENIQGREKVLDWHSRLPADHPYKVGPGGDRNMIAVLQRTYAVLDHDGVHERQEEVRRRSPVVQAIRGQLLLPAVRHPLPLKVIPINAGEQRSRTHP